MSSLACAILSGMNESQNAKRKTQSEKYEPSKIEPYWQSVWGKEKIYQPDLDTASRHFYNLMMFPYPSAEGLHVGNMYAFTGADVYGRFKRMQGFEVFEPIGLDGFGIHSENYALKVGSHPIEQAEESEQNFYRQLHSIGNGYDWSRTVETWKPDYYKWTQWVFTQLFKAGLAYRAEAKVNWCPSCKTVLADEQVLQKVKNVILNSFQDPQQQSKEMLNQVQHDKREEQVTIGVCERCETPVEKRNLKQWFFRITGYAERLLQDLDKIDWTEKVKIAQRNWIGKSTGASIRFPLATKYNFVLLHGFTGGPNNDFHPWIKKELEKRGYKVQIPALPNTDHPTEQEQVEYVLQNVEFDENTILMGHSLGSVVALKVVEKLDKKIAGLVLAAGFVEAKFNDHDRPFKETFKWEFDFAKIKKNVGFVKVLRDSSDSVVPAKQADILAEKLEGRVVDFTAQGEHITGEQEPVVLENLVPSLEAFTTRPDTLYGATFMVLSPEHPLVQEILKQVQDDKVKKTISEYVERAQNKSEQERIEEGREKTGIFSGLYAINPVTHKEIPIWIADYVLMGYGTGAIMAVPAHDQRDYEFAKKYDLPITHVVMPSRVDKVNPPQEGKENTKRHVVLIVVKDPKEDKYLTLKWKDQPWQTFITGGLEEGEDPVQAAKREIAEETGYADVKFVRELGGPTEAFFYAAHKGLNRQTKAHLMYFELGSHEQSERGADERDRYDIVWLSEREIHKARLRHSELDLIWERLKTGNDAYIGSGVLINSTEWDGLRVPEEIDKTIADLEKKGIGKKQVQYHLRDWLISRQRYWGAPIPMIFCQACADKGESWFTTEEGKSWFTENRHSGKRGTSASRIDSGVLANARPQNDDQMVGWYPVPEDQLPVILPKIDDYRPVGTGKAPLANHPEFYETTCPACGGKAIRETDVSDTFLDSSWYFLRYLATDWDDIPFPSKAFLNSKSEARNPKQIENTNDQNSKQFRNSDFDIRVSARAAWLPVSQYTGGAEHSVLHLLYARFVYKVFADLGYISTKGRSSSGRESGGDEPFPKFFAHGLIIKDGAKMSKSKGNVVVPDEYIRKYGADTLRTYLMFLGPFSDGGDFQDAGIAGIHRFLKRVWTLFTTKEISSSEAQLSAKVMMHRTIKGVSLDLASFRYNTAIAKIMAWYNSLSDQKSVTKEELTVFLQLLAPFAPHLTEELYQRLVIAIPSSSREKQSYTDGIATSVASGEPPRNDEFQSIHTSSWPSYDDSLLVNQTITIAVQVNGKLRDTIEIAAEKQHEQQEVEDLAKQSEKVRRFIDGKDVKQVIYVPGRVLNFVLV